MRKICIDALHNKGDFNHNVSVLQNSGGKLHVAKYLSKEISDKDYLSCEYCLRFYLKRNLHRRMGKCRNKPEHQKGKKVMRNGQLTIFV